MMSKGDVNTTLVFALLLCLHNSFLWLPNELVHSDLSDSFDNLHIRNYTGYIYTKGEIHPFLPIVSLLSLYMR